MLIIIISVNLIVYKIFKTKLLILICMKKVNKIISILKNYYRECFKKFIKELNLII